MLPLLVFVGGPPGSGKSTLARRVSDLIPALVLPQDDVAAAIRRARPDVVGRDVFAVFMDLVERAVRSGVSVVAEGAFTSRLARELARFDGVADLRFVRCTAEQSVCRRRVIDRARVRSHELDRLGVDAVNSPSFDWTAFDFALPIPTLIAATDDGIPALDAVVAFCRRA